MPFLHGYILFLAYFSEANDKENDRKLNWSHGFIHSIFYRLSLFWPGEGDGDFLLYLCMIFLIFLWEIDGNREVIKFTKIRLISFCLSLIYFHNFEKLLTFYILRGSFFLLFFALVLFSRQEWVVVLDNLLSLLDIFLPVDDILLIFLLF
jgi:hypothetical protein